MARQARHTLPPSTQPGMPEEPKALTKQEFGRRLQNLLRDRNWNQSDLARAAGLGRDAISTYVRGRSFPEPKSLQKLAEALSTTPQQLLPNTVLTAMDKEFPALEIKQASGHPDRCWLRLNRLVTPMQAMKIMQVLQETPAPDAADTHH